MSLSSAIVWAALLNLLFLMWLISPLSGRFTLVLQTLILMSMTGLAISGVGLIFLKEWSHSATSWAHVPGRVVPLLCLGLCIYFGQNSKSWISSKVDEIIRMVLLVIGGSFVVANNAWIALIIAERKAVPAVGEFAMALIKFFAPFWS